MAQPLSRVKSNAIVTVSPVALQMRPLLAATVMQVIGVWSHTDGDLATVLSAMLKADIAAGSAMYLKLTTRRARIDVLEAAAEHALSAEDFEILKATIRAIKPSYQQRDRFAHQAWGFSDDLDDALLLIPPEEITKLNVMRRQQTENEKVPVSVENGQVRYAIPLIPPGRLDPSKITVYRAADLERALTDAGEANHLVWWLFQIAAPGIDITAARANLRQRVGLSDKSA